MDSHFRHVAENLRRDVDQILSRVGLLYRVFGRGKAEDSLRSKIGGHQGKYAVGGRLVQDSVGIRVVLYFSDDIEIVSRLLTARYKIDESATTVDLHANDQFTVRRHNLVFCVPDDYLDEVRRAIGGRPIDTTFEVQIRTVLSEGWHEVDHDLRYKSKASWDGHDDLSRALNGIFATLETAEWSMARIFDELAYRHYRSKRWAEMLHSRMRLRVQPTISADLLECFTSNQDLGKEAFRMNRMSVLNRLLDLSVGIPITLDNAVFTWNFLYKNDEKVLSVTPEFLIEIFQELSAD